jgi:hypothetical protein
MYSPKVFENKPLRRIFGPERKAVTGGRMKPQSEEPNERYSTLHIPRVVKSRKMNLKEWKHTKEK